VLEFGHVTRSMLGVDQHQVEPGVAGELDSRRGRHLDDQAEQGAGVRGPEGTVRNRHHPWHPVVAPRTRGVLNILSLCCASRCAVRIVGSMTTEIPSLVPAVSVASDNASRNARRSSLLTLSLATPRSIAASTSSSASPEAP